MIKFPWVIAGIFVLLAIGLAIGSYLEADACVASARNAASLACSGTAVVASLLGVVINRQ